MKWILNSAVISAGAYGTYEYAPATREDLRAFLAGGDAISRIGYAETAEVIERWTGFRPALSREVSPLEPGDEAMVVRLRYRVEPGRKGAPVAASDADWEIARLTRRS